MHFMDSGDCDFTYALHVLIYVLSYSQIPMHSSQATRSQNPFLTIHTPLSLVIDTNFITATKENTRMHSARFGFVLTTSRCWFKWGQPSGGKLAFSVVKTVITVASCAHGAYFDPRGGRRKRRRSRRPFVATMHRLPSKRAATYYHGQPSD